MFVTGNAFACVDAFAMCLYVYRGPANPAPRKTRRIDVPIFAEAWQHHLFHHFKFVGGGRRPSRVGC